jgi:DNA anti-recombination protein RmuC
VTRRFNSVDGSVPVALERQSKTLTEYAGGIRVRAQTPMTFEPWDGRPTTGEKEGHMTDDESQALLNIAGRQDAPSIKTAQTAARTRLRAEAEAKRRELTAALKRKRTALRAAAKERQQRFESEMEQVTFDMELAVKKSNRDIEQRFQQIRRTQLDGGVIGQAIAQRDVV